MEYNDDAIMTPEEYGQLAKAYAESQKSPGFVFVKLDRDREREVLGEVFSLLGTLKSNLFALGGFLGTGALFNLNNKHVERLERLFDAEFSFKQQRFMADKTKCFLNMLSLEARAINKLLELALCSPHVDEIVGMIKERTELVGSLFQVNGIISSFVR